MEEEGQADPGLLRLCICKEKEAIMSLHTCNFAGGRGKFKVSLIYLVSFRAKEREGRERTNIES